LRTYSSHLSDAGYIAADARDTFGVLKEFFPVEFPARVAAGRLDPGPHVEVGRLPEVHHLLGVLGAPLHFLGMIGEERTEVDDAPHALTQLARNALHHRHHLYTLSF